ncbi:MAG: FG-GAP repeat protein [Enhydrobacter sp.]|nr:FG-GAP repeat protein [Enhydrobacter sp.]
MAVKSIALSSLDGSNGFQLNGVRGDDFTGASVSSAGDINGDGFDDVIVGASNAASGGGAYVVFGKARGFADNFDLSKLNGRTGFLLQGKSSDIAGSSVASAGDVNGDGLDDMIVGAPGNGGGRGAAYVVFGKRTPFASKVNLAKLNGTDGFRLVAGVDVSSGGQSVASAGDLNGDGFDDLLMGSGSGAKTYVVFGKASGFAANVNLELLNGADGFLLKYNSGDGGNGVKVSSAGDVNGDGFDDLIVGSPDADMRRGEAYVVFGKASGFDSRVYPDQLDGTDGFRLHGGFADIAGAVCSAGDFNGDGFDDLIVGAPGDPVYLGLFGTAYVVFGKASGFSADIDLTQLKGASGFKISASSSVDALGFSVSAAGDVDGDGLADLILSAPFGGDERGTSYILFGKESGLPGNLILDAPRDARVLRLTGEAAHDFSGWSVSGAGDVNGDGRDDLVVGAPAADTNGSSSGQAYVVFGTAVGQPLPYFIDALRAPVSAPSIRHTWNAADGKPVTITYSFMSSVPTGEGIGTSVAGGNPFTTFQPFDASLRTAARTALQSWAAVSGITFVEISAAEEATGRRGMIEFGSHSMSPGTGGYATAPNFVNGALPTGTQAGNIFIDRSLTLDSSELRSLLLRQIGIAVGLATPATGTLPENEDLPWNTVMNRLGVDSYPLGPFDIAAIQQIYGVNPAIRTEANSYAFGQQRYIWDGGGIDMISAAAMSAGVTLTLTPGSWNYAGVAPASSILAANQLFIGYGTTIENAIGSNFADTLIGNDLANTLDGGGGVDRLDGGRGDDTYLVDTSSDLVIEFFDRGIDTVRSTTQFTLSDNVENLILLGANAAGYGNALANRMTGSATNDTLDGMGGADTMDGGAGNDTYYVDDIGDVVVELASQGTDLVRSSIGYTLGANLENLELIGFNPIAGTGNALANVLAGNWAANLLDGGIGADTMQGSYGDDIYVVDNAGDKVIDESGAGVDTVRSTLDYVLGADLEKLELLGKALKATGNALANTLVGNAGKNVLDGAAGADTMAGGRGDDLYIVDNAGDVAIELEGEGKDKVESSASFTLGFGIEELVLLGTATDAIGNEQANILAGNAMANLLDGRAGGDRMKGGLDNDVYIADDAGDKAIEAADEGTDLVRSAVNFTLGNNVENLELLTSASRGTGNGLANHLSGNASNNLLDGKGGADTMAGGAGDDVYVVDNASDVVVELVGAGIDTVKASARFVLSDNIEMLLLTGSDDIAGTGNTLDNTLTGNEGSNLLDGKTGADMMRGGKGDDIYVVDDANDRVAEVAGEGADQVQSTVSYSLGSSLEDLVLLGKAAIDGAGNAAANRLTGNAAANKLSGGAGDDTLCGRGGSDILTGGAGRDIFLFDSTIAAGNIDTLADFFVAEDTIQLDNAVFADLALGLLQASAFAIGSAAQNGSHRVIYNATTGNLMYDADGQGGAAARTIAVLTANLALTSADFIVV